MPLLRKQQEGDLLWGIWKIEEESSELLSFFEDATPYLEGIQSFSSDNRVKEWLSVRVLLAELCGEVKHINYFPSGKPFLADNSYYISISHTKGYVAVALHPSGEVGIDIEQYGNKVCRVRHKFLQQVEEEHVPEKDEIYYLLLCWSAKETVYKIMGREDVELKEHLLISSFDLSERGQFDVKELKTEAKTSFLVNYIVYPEFVITYSSSGL